MPTQTKKSKPIQLLIIIPGNPGIAAYYKQFEEKLDNLTKNQFKIHTLNYKGFQNFPQDRQYNLHEELEDKIEQLNNILSSYKKIFKQNSNSEIKITLIGHSIGSWIAHEIMNRLPDHSINKIFYVFPFFHTDNSSKLQKFISFMLKAPLLFKIILGIHYILTSLPKLLLNLIILPRLKHMNPNSIFVTWKYFIQHKHILKSIFYLAKSEFKILPDQIELENYSNRINDRYFLYNTEDMWAPIASLNLLKHEFKNLNYSLYKGSLHDFCVSDPGVDWVSSEIAKFIYS